MTTNERWILPQGVEDVLPGEAWQLENFRQDLLRLFYSHGYDLVRPPLIEYLDSLLTGTGRDLDLQTFKITDQNTGKLMGIRADMTPQVARMEARYIKRQGPVRLCYFGPTLVARPRQLGGSREPLQFGAELYGEGGPHSDGEVLQLMVKALLCLGISDLHINVGHVGLFRELIREADITTDIEIELFDILQRKSKPDLRELAAVGKISKSMTRTLLQLMDLNGNVSVLSRAREMLPADYGRIAEALSELQALADFVHVHLPDIELHYDLAELRGYHYHTGIVFDAMVPGVGQELAKGGRYDNIGQSFGYARPATGFSADLRLLLKAMGNGGAQASRCIAAPIDDEPALLEMIEKLRSSGERVVLQLPGQDRSTLRESCDRLLKKSEGQWQLSEI